MFSSDNHQPIFYFLNPQDNDLLSQMNGKDLRDFIVLLDYYYLKLRNQLGIDPSITFGLELEFKRISKQRIENKVKKKLPNDKWFYSDDITGVHEISTPIFTDIKQNWEAIYKCCNLLSRYTCVDGTCGGHIHIGNQILLENNKFILNFAKLWAVYENIIFRFAYGEFLNERHTIMEYAYPVAQKFWKFYQIFKDKTDEEISYFDVLDFLAMNEKKKINAKDQAILFRFLKGCYKSFNTIEFRCPNGSLNPVIWQNNVNFFVHLLNYAKSTGFDDKIIETRQQYNGELFSNIHSYNEIFLDQALELCDMIFTNNLDKVYFLRQYLKSFQVCREKDIYAQEPIYTKARKFTKRGWNDIDLAN